VNPLYGEAGPGTSQGGKPKKPKKKKTTTPAPQANGKEVYCLVLTVRGILTIVSI